MRSTRSTSAERHGKERRPAAETRDASHPPRGSARSLQQLMYRACAEVLATAAQLPVSAQLPGPTELRQQLTAALDKMVSRGRRAAIPDADLAEARYALVALLDEQVLKANWTGRTEWMNRPLQFDLYRDNNAGEDFFVRLSALLRNGGRPFAVQVYYLCLALGFQGMYAQNGDAKALAKFTRAARQQLESALAPPDNLSPHGAPQRVARAATRGHGMVGWVVVGGLFLIALTVALTGWSVERELRSAIAEIAGSPLELPGVATP
jgi:type IV/VI secretion system ImpK/VasF family protein